MVIRRIKRLIVIFILLFLSAGAIVTVQARGDLGEYDWAGFDGPVNIGFGNYWQGPRNEEFTQKCKEQSFLFFTDIMGMTEESACAILGNMENEGGFDPTTTEGRKPWSETLPLLGGLGGGLGMVGFTDPSVMAPWGNLCKEQGVPWTDLDCQLNAIAEVLPNVVEISKNAGFPYADPKINTWEDFKNSKDLVSCCIIFIHGYERCQGYYTEEVHKKRAESGQRVLEEMRSKGLTGKQYEAKNNPPEVYNNNQVNKNHNANDQLESDDTEERVARDEWSLEGMPEKSTFMQESKTPVQTTTRGELTAREQIELGNLKENVEATTIANRVSFRRRLVTMAGLLFCIYATLVLVAYVFDVNNPFFELSLVSILTLGMFHPKYINRAVGGNGSFYQTMHQGDDTKKMFVMVLMFFALGLLLCTGGVGVFIFQKIDFMNSIADGAYNFFAGVGVY